MMPKSSSPVDTGPTPGARKGRRSRTALSALLLGLAGTGATTVPITEPSVAPSIPSAASDSVLLLDDSLRSVIRAALAAAAPGRPIRIAQIGDSHSEQGGFAAEVAAGLSRETPFGPAFVTPYSRGLGLTRIALSSGWRRSTWRSGPVGQVEGPSGSAAVTESRRATLRLQLPTNLPRGTKVTLWWTGPAGASFTVRSGDRTPRTIRRSRRTGDGPLQRTPIAITPDEPTILLESPRLPRGGQLRIGGFVIERPDAIAEVDLLGLSATTHRHPVAREAGSLSQFLRVRHHDVILVWFGSNSLGERHLDDGGFRSEYEALLRLIRRANPAAALVLIGPPDLAIVSGRCPSAQVRSGARTRRPPPPITCPGRMADDGRGAETCLRQTHPNVPVIRRVEREIARDHRAAFFDPFLVQGEAGGMVRWHCEEPSRAAKDLIHLTELGYRDLARSFVARLTAPASSP